MSEILDVAERFRKQLAKQDATAVREMSRLYAQSWMRLRPKLDEVTRLIGDAEKAGKHAVVRIPGSGAALGPDEYSFDWLRRQARYIELMYQCELELVSVAQPAAAMVGRLQARSLEAGKTHAEGLMSASLGPVPADMARVGIRVTWNRVPREALASLVGFLGDGSPLAYKFVGLAPETAQDIKDIFATGLLQGWGPRKIAAEVKRTYQGAMENVLLTARTETLRAYRTAAHETYKANSDIVKGWIRQCAKQTRTCAACWAMDGTFHELSEPLNDHPTGRCTQLPVTKSWGELLGDKFADVPDHSAKPWDSEEQFNKLRKTDQLAVLGPTRYKLWSDGQVKLRDMAVKQRSTIWGDHYRPKTAKELAAEGKVPRMPTKGSKAPAAKTGGSAPPPAKPPKRPTRSGSPGDEPRKARLKPPTTWTRRVLLRHRQVIAQTANEFGLTPQQYRQQATQRVREMVSQGHPCIQVRQDRLGSVLRDGRFKSQFETGTSGGLLHPVLRAETEKAMFGLPDDLDPKKRPIYGFLGQANGDQVGRAAQYGDVTVRLRKSRVQPKMTITFGDSLDHTDCGRNPTLVPMAPRSADYRTSENLRSSCPLRIDSLADLYDGSNNYGYSLGYIEAQYNTLSVEDIEEVVFHNLAGYNAHKLDLEQRGIRCRMARP